MINQFDTEVAMQVGINAAVIYRNIQYWCEKNRTNEMNEHEGLFWTYNSIKAFCKQFPYLTEKQIRSSLKLLEEKGYIKSGNFNKSSYDRTKWYADLMPRMSDSNCLVGQMENDEKANRNALDGEPIPNINTNNINTDINNIYISADENFFESLPDKPKKKFVPPTVEEVTEYCNQRNNNVDPESFIAYYASQNWKKANGRPINDWKLCVITWEKKDARRHDPTKKTGNPFDDILAEEGYT